MADPRKPAIPIAAEDDPDHVIINSRYETRRAHTLVYTQDDTNRLREGYCCINCGESQVGHEGPMPENCWLCGYEMRAKQAERFAKEFKGTLRIGPSTSIDEELAIAEEYVRREELKQRGMTPSGIVVPSGLL